MQPATVDAGHDTTELDGLLGSWRRHLTAQRMSPATLSTYSTSVTQLTRFLALRGMPTSPASITREHVEAFITDLLGRWRPTTAHNRYRALQSFFRWLVDEGEIRDNPMVRMKPPRLPEEPPPVLRDSDLRHLLQTCASDRTHERRLARTADLTAQHMLTLPARSAEARRRRAAADTKAPAADMEDRRGSGARSTTG